MKRTLTLDNVSTKLQRIAELAKTAPQMAIRTLAHHIDVEFLHAAYDNTRKDGAVGVDRQTAAEYAANLEANLQSLLDRFKSGTYFAPPVRRVEIPKADGTKRPLGIPTFEDKVLQRAVSMVLGAVYEQDFLDCSYGFRPGRSAHDALDALWRELMKVHGGWVLDIDIRRYFESVDHGHLRAILDQRVRDGVIRRTIDKWLKAGVQHAGMLSYPGEGTPQGGVISPLLSNIYLHEILDVWFEREVRPRLDADDVAIVFEQERDARRVLDVIAKRFAKYLKRDKNDQRRGGKRPGAGRKPKGSRAGSPHKARPELEARHPQHVTMRAPFSSGVCFDGWRAHIETWDWPTDYEPPEVSRPQTWLLADGWKRGKPISSTEIPGRGTHPR